MWLDGDVFCEPSVVFTNVYSARLVIVEKSQYPNTHVGRGVNLGLNCTIIFGTIIGSFVFVGAGALVDRNVRP